MVQFTVTDQFRELVPVRIEDYQPAYGGRSVGLDLYSMANIEIPPLLSNPYWLSIELTHYKTLIPTGIKLKLPLNTQGLILERGSITKTPLKIRAGVVDPDYTDQVFINCINLSAKTWRIKAGEKTPFQLVCTPTLAMRYITENDYQANTKDSIRGTACLGSTD